MLNVGRLDSLGFLCVVGQKLRADYLYIWTGGIQNGLAGNVGDMSRGMSHVVRMSPDCGDIAMSPRHFLWWHVTLVMSQHIHSYLFIYRVSLLWHSFCHNVNMWQSHVADMSCVATSCVSENADISCCQHSQLRKRVPFKYYKDIVVLKWRYLYCRGRISFCVIIFNINIGNKTMHTGNKIGTQQLKPLSARTPVSLL